ncbi:MAG: hypothetical protein ACOYT8_02365 [Candidatus Dependentiae bacterium]
MNSSNPQIVQNCQVHTAYTLLKYTYGIVALIVGLDKFFGFVTHWPKYVSPYIAQYLPAGFTMQYLLGSVGIIEIVVGLLVLNKKYTQIGAYILAAWLGIIALNLLTIGGYFDIAVRDLVLAVGAIALALLSKVCCK